ncbi:MAG: hypothetical protein ABSG44_21640, partial [Thermodesulfobacteriota bacterium]
TGGREHTEVRALDPGRSSFSCLSLSLVYSLYNTITGRRALDPGRSSFSCLSLSLVYSLYNTITGRRKEHTS